jgi:hypothetical protein
MTRTAVLLLVDLLEDAFERDDEHSLLGNLRAIDHTAWRWTPAEGERTIGGVVWHAGSAKYLYHSHAFGDGSVTWDHPLCATSNARTIEEAMTWLREGHRLFVEGVKALSDADLDRVRPVHWGPSHPLRFPIATMIKHDLFHAGEINHLRALRHRNDRWGYFGPPTSAADD